MEPAFRGTASALLALTLAFMPSPSWAVKACKAKANRKNGIIYVRASGVSGTLLWGIASGSESQSFANTSTCIQSGKARGCQLGATGTPEAITPPPLCTIFVRDSAAECAAFLSGCSPGSRGAIFGDTKYAANEAAPAGLPACADTVVLSIPITVAAPSRIYSVGSGVYDSNGSSLALGSIRTELTDSTDSVTLAVTGVTLVQTGVFNNPAPMAIYGESNGVMRSGTNAYAAAGQPAFVAAPGNYTLKLIAGSGNGTCLGTPTFSNAALTYLLVGTF